MVREMIGLHQELSVRVETEDVFLASLKLLF